jgi:hypothetical protein
VEFLVVLLKQYPIYFSIAAHKLAASNKAYSWSKSLFRESIFEVHISNNIKLLIMEHNIWLSTLLPDSINDEESGLVSTKASTLQMPLEL